MAPTDRDSKLQKSGVIYKFKCPHINCPEEYIGESGSFFGTDSRSILGPHPLSTTIATLKGTQSALNVLPLSPGSQKGSEGTLRRLCISM